MFPESQRYDLPKIFDVNETKYCPNGQVYCSIHINLDPLDPENPPEIWRRIEEINDSGWRFYRRDKIYRAGCIDKNSFSKSFDEYKYQGLIGSVDYSFCNEKNKPDMFMNGMVIFFIIFAILYIMFIIYFTIKTHKTGKGKVNKYIETFSLMNIWNDIRKPNRNDDFQRLISIQGMRTIAILIVISAHDFTGTLVRYLENPEYIENMYLDTLKALLIRSYLLIVQTFFTISGWLFALQLWNFVRKNGRITAKDLLLLVLNRYFRLIPAIVIQILLILGSSIFELIDPLYESMSHAEITRCLTSWWKNLLHIQNLEIFGGETCSTISWYVAADTQMYILVAIVFFLSENLRISLNYLIFLIATIAISVQGYNVLSSDYEGLFRFCPRILPYETAFTSPIYIHFYASTVSNLPTYSIGFVFGIFYSKNKRRIIFDTPGKKIIWFLTFIGLPLLAIHLTYLNVSRIMKALISVSFKPIFGLGMAVGILGMATGTGGPLKVFFESKPLVFLGNFTVSIYMFHVLVIYLTSTSSGKLHFLDDFVYMRNSFINIALSFIIGIVMYIILEHPCIRLQKIILPQVNTKEVQKHE